LLKVLTVPVVVKSFWSAMVAVGMLSLSASFWRLLLVLLLRLLGLTLLLAFMAIKVILLLEVKWVLAFVRENITTSKAIFSPDL